MRASLTMHDVPAEQRSQSKWTRLFNHLKEHKGFEKAEELDISLLLDSENLETDSDDKPSGSPTGQTRLKKKSAEVPCDHETSQNENTHSNKPRLHFLDHKRRSPSFGLDSLDDDEHDDVRTVSDDDECCCQIVHIVTPSCDDTSEKDTSVELCWEDLDKSQSYVESRWTLESKPLAPEYLFKERIKRNKHRVLKQFARYVLEKFTARLLIVKSTLSFCFWHEDEATAANMASSAKDLTTFISGLLPEKCRFSQVSVHKCDKLRQQGNASPTSIPLQMENTIKDRKHSSGAGGQYDEIALVRTRMEQIDINMNTMQNSILQFMADVKNQVLELQRQTINLRKMFLEHSLSKPQLPDHSTDTMTYDLKELFSGKFQDFLAKVIVDRTDSCDPGAKKKTRQVTAQEVLCSTEAECSDTLTPGTAKGGDLRTAQKSRAERAYNEEDQEEIISLVEKQIKDLPQDSLDEAETILYHFGVSDVGTRRGRPEIQHLAESIALALQDHEKSVPRAKGPDTILCLDVSESMGEAGLEEVKRLAHQFVDGMEKVAEEHSLEENIGVVTMGGRSVVIQHLTNDYSKVRDALNEAELGGRSPVFEALLVCAAAIKDRGGVLCLGTQKHKIRPRIIFLTDGLLTNYKQWTGADMCSTENENKMRIIQLVQHMSSRLEAFAPSPIIWVPVGKADKTFLSSLAKLGKGQFVEPNEMDSLISNFKIQSSIKGILACVANHDGDEEALRLRIETVTEALVGNLSPADKIKVVGAVLAQLDRGLDSDDEDGDDRAGKLREKNDILPLGSRVVRGPDWRWGEQDGGGPGTVVNHDTEDYCVWVHWDFTAANCRYRYGYDSCYDLLVMDIPRTLRDDELIEIGVAVQRGPNWSHGEQDGGPGNRGVVIRKRVDGTVKVRWNTCGKIQSYSFGKDGKFDLEICKPDNFQGQSSKEDSVENIRQERKYPVWQWQDDFTNWCFYSQGDTAKLEREFQRKPRGSCIVQKNKKIYRILFGKDPMVEKCLADNTLHTVKRLEMTDDELVLARYAGGSLDDIEW